MRRKPRFFCANISAAKRKKYVKSKRKAGRYLVFSSIVFLYVFLPLALAVYFLSPKRFKNAALLLLSFVFYFYGGQFYVLIMMLDIAVAYAFGLLIDKYRGKKAAKVFLFFAVAACLGLLGFFKYYDFFAENVGALGASLPSLGLILPIGISFFTFQAISYDVDVYRGSAAVQKNVVSLATYVALFPQLIAGPIVRYADVANQLEKRSVTAKDLSSGAFRFTVGLAKKVIVADNLFAFTEFFSSSRDKSVAFCWAYAAALTLYVYYDFSGYSDMAIGLGRIFGFNFNENFNYPLVSESVGEFWRRWHISLGSWFRDYVYVPLGGNRVSAPRWIFNTLLVWFLTGLWHGAAWNFILWGLYFGLLIIAEKTVLKGVIEKTPRFIRHVYLLVAVAVSFVIFGADGIGGAAEGLQNMFGLGGLPLWSDETAYYLSSFGVIFAVAAVGATPLIKNAAVKFAASNEADTATAILKPVVMAFFIIISTAYFADGSFSPFLYFRF